MLPFYTKIYYNSKLPPSNFWFCPVSAEDLGCLGWAFLRVLSPASSGLSLTWMVVVLLKLFLEWLLRVHRTQDCHRKDPPPDWYNQTLSHIARELVKITEPQAVPQTYWVRTWILIGTRMHVAFWETLEYMAGMFRATLYLRWDRKPKAGTGDRCRATTAYLVRFTGTYLYHLGHVGFCNWEPSLRADTAHPSCTGDAGPRDLWLKIKMEMAHPGNAKIPDTTELIILHYHHLITLRMLACHRRNRTKEACFSSSLGRNLVVWEKIQEQGVQAFINNKVLWAHLLLYPAQWFWSLNYSYWKVCDSQ